MGLLYIVLGKCETRSVDASIEVVERGELSEVWLCVFEFIYFYEYEMNMKLSEVLVLLSIEKKEADAIESVFNLKGLLTETKVWFKPGLNLSVGHKATDTSSKSCISELDFK